MAKFSSSAIAARTTSAQFQALVNEVQNALVTQCGLSQLSPLMDTGQMAVPCVSALPGAANTMAGYYMFAFNDALSLGPLVSGTALASVQAGTGYNGGSAGTFSNVGLAGGTGTGATATVVVGASGAITSITPSGSSSAGYCLGDQLSVTSAAIVAAGGAAGGSGGSAFVNQLTNAAAPCLIKFEFGTASVTSDTQWLITVGTSWTSAGTVGAAQCGAVTTRVATLTGLAPLSTSQFYNSRYCYNSTYGFLGIVFKQAAQNATQFSALGALFIFRTSSNAGTPNGNGMAVITCGSTIANPSVAATNGYMQVISYTNNLITPPLSGTTSNGWLGYTAANGGPNYLFGLTSTIVNGVAYAMPVITLDPVPRFSAVLGVALSTEFPIHTTNPATFAFIGATGLTFLSVGFIYGQSGFAGSSFTGLTLLMLWE